MSAATIPVHRASWCAHCNAFVARQTCPLCGGDAAAVTEFTAEQAPHFRCLECGYEGEITMQNIAAHRSSGCLGPTQMVEDEA